MNTNNKLINLIIRVDKKDSAFTYFILEAHEGLSFYSTLEHQEGDGFRDIDIKGTVELKSELLHVINFLQNQVKIDILKKEIIDDY